MKYLRKPTPKQIKLAKFLNIETEGKSFRVLGAKIADALQIKSFQIVEQKGIKEGSRVKYVGKRNNMPELLTVSTVAKNAFIYFKKTSKYCRPWELKILNQET